MIIPEALYVENWATWQSGKIPLNVPGITFVRGINMDASGNPNGAGKSSCFNAMYAANFGDHQLATRKRSLKSITREHTRIRQVLDVDGKRVVSDMRGTDMKVQVDGKPIDSRVKGDDRLRMLALMNTSAELWESTVHVNGIASNPLVRGTSASRCQFLERAFDLDRWSGSYAKVGDMLATFKRVQLDLDADRAELKTLSGDDPNELEQSCTELSATVEKLRKRLRNIGERAAVARSLPPKPERSLAHYTKACRVLEQRLIEAMDCARAQRAYDEARRARSEILVRLEQFPKRTTKPRDIEKLRNRIADLSSSINDAIAINRHAPDVKAWLKLATSVAQRHGIRYETKEDLRSLCRGWVANIRAGDSSCPVCGGSLKKPVSREDVEELARLMARLPSGELVSRPVANLPELQAECNDVRGMLTAETNAQRDEVMREDLEKELGYVRVPKRPDSDLDELQVRSKLADMQKHMRAAELWDDITNVEDADELNESYERLDKHIVKLNARLSDLQSKAEDARACTKLRANLEQRIDRLEAEVAAQPAYKALHAAYSPTGMRLWLLSELLEALIEGLNEVARTMQDRVMFGYKLGRNRDLTITASNINGTFDVRLLSGAEGKMFCLNLLTVLLPLLPSRRRCNLLILDELDGNCSPQTIDIMARDYIPRLAQTVGTLMVITPNKSNVFNVPGAHQLTIQKSRGVSSVREYVK